MSSETRVHDVYMAWREDRSQDPTALYLQQVDDHMAWLGDLATDARGARSIMMADLADLKHRVANDALTYDEAEQISTLARGSLKNRASELRRQGVSMPHGKIHLSRIPLKPGLEFLLGLFSGEATPTASPPSRTPRTGMRNGTDFDAAELAQDLNRSR